MNFDTLDIGDLSPGADVFCALGTTIRVAGSQDAFRKVDFGHVVNLAQQSAARGARQFLVVSSAGADAATSNFYLRTKAEMEQAVSTLSFEAVHIFRPSLLLGKRRESRPAERVGVLLARAIEFALVGKLRKYRAIEADIVAASMTAAARAGKSGIHIYDFDEMTQMVPAS